MTRTLCCSCWVGNRRACMRLLWAIALGAKWDFLIFKYLEPRKDSLSLCNSSIASLESATVALCSSELPSLLCLAAGAWVYWCLCCLQPLVSYPCWWSDGQEASQLPQFWNLHLHRRPQGVQLWRRHSRLRSWLLLNRLLFLGLTGVWKCGCSDRMVETSCFDDSSKTARCFKCWWFSCG